MLQYRIFLVYILCSTITKVTKHNKTLNMNVSLLGIGSSVWDMDSSYSCYLAIFKDQGKRRKFFMNKMNFFFLQMKRMGRDYGLGDYLFFMGFALKLGFKFRAITAIAVVMHCYNLI